MTRTYLVLPMGFETVKKKFRLSDGDECVEFVDSPPIKVTPLVLDGSEERSEKGSVLIFRHKADGRSRHFRHLNRQISALCNSIRQV